MKIRHWPVAVLSLPLLAFGQVEELRVREASRPFDGEVGGVLRETDVKVSLGADDPTPSFNTHMAFRYTTASVDALKDYAVVQFIRGCLYHSELGPDGRIMKNLGVARQFFGQDRQPFRHPEWVVDSVDVDPMFNNGAEGEDRHGPYRSNSVQGSFAPETSTYLFRLPQAYWPELSVTDHPSGAMASFRGMRNASLQFKTCLFRSVDVPRVSTPSGMRAEDALFCLEWDSIWAYDHAAGAYRRGTELDPFCLE